MNKTLRVFLDIFVGYFLLFPNLLIFIYLFENLGFYKYFVLGILCIWNGIVFHYLTLFIHAAAHFNIFPQNRKVNDLLSNIFLGYFFLMPIKNYRKKHFKHHYHLGTEQDPEDSYKYELNTTNFLKWFFFYYPIKKLFFMFFTEKKNKFTFDVQVVISVLVFLSFHVLSLIYFLSISAMEVYIFLIFIPQTMVLPVINWLRTSLEHAPLELEKKTFALRNFDNANNFLSFLFGAAGFKLHDIHHHNPGIHYLDLSAYKDKYKLENSDNYSNVIQELYYKSKNI